MNPIWFLGYLILTTYCWIVILHVILHWLVAFNVINTRNQFIYTIMDILYRLTEPALRVIRRWVPTINGVDLSPMVLLIAIIFLQYTWDWLWFRASLI